MPGMQSAAMTLLLPAGAAFDPQHASGAATVLSDLVLRGAGSRNSRQLTDFLDSLGLQRSSSAAIHHTRFTAASLADRVFDALNAYLDIVRRPLLPQSGFDAARDLALQSLEGIEDEPRQKVLIRLREQHFPYPFGRNILGNKQELLNLSLDVCKEQHQKFYIPNDSILALAGNVHFPSFRHLAERLFADWPPAPHPHPNTTPAPLGYLHVQHPSEQTHIGLAWPSIQETHPLYYVMRLAIEVLGGGMSGRLFTEIREKRALVYSVWAGYTSLKGFGSIMGYAGASNDRAQATLDAFIDEIYRLANGITPDELQRAKIGLKAATIMQGESTSARSASIAHDFFMRGRIRTLDEVKNAIDSVTLDQVNHFLNTNTPGPFTIVTVGPNSLKIPQL